MDGWLIVNEFMHSKKFSELAMWLLDSAKKMDVHLTLHTNADILVCLQSKEPSLSELKQPDFVLFWDKDIRLAKWIEQFGIPVFNQSKAIQACDDKAMTHLLLQKNGIPMPKTIVAPMTYDVIGYTNYNFLKQIEKQIGYPMVVKECFGSFGAQVFLAHDYDELLTIVKERGTKPMLFQEFIQTSFAKDVRIQVVGREVVASMYRYSDNGDFRANITNGGKMLPYEPNDQQKALAVECCRILGLDFGGVDLLFGENDEPIVCEVNSNAHFKNIMDCTGVNVADYMIAHIKKQMTDLA